MPHAGGRSSPVGNLYRGEASCSHETSQEDPLVVSLASFDSMAPRLFVDVGPDQRTTYIKDGETAVLAACGPVRLG
jgi:hypothetical protein